MTRTYDLLGIGIGPFDLGLAALAEPLADVDAVFLDQRDGFSWHAGMLIEGTTLQVPFLADLVTMADPTSAYSFLAWLKETGRLYQFYIRESFYPLRAEYDQYCRWVAAQLPTLRWGREVTSVVRVPDPAAEAGDPGESGYVFEVTAQTADGVEKYCAKHLVLGTGTRPRLPAALIGVAGLDGRAGGEGGGPVVHTSDYLPNRDALRAAGSVTVVGSGQSAAEVYRDLLEDCGTGPGEHRVDWVTRSPRFFPMEYTKLTLEMTSPEYTDHYVALPIEQRDVLGREQRNLYKGISGDLIDDIYDTLYRRSALGAEVPTTLLSDTEVVAARFEPAGPDAAGAGEYVLTLRHAQLGTTVEHRTGAIVAATGYAATVPAFLAPGLVNLDARGRYAVARDYTVDDDRRIHVVGGEEHTHGVTAPDLGFGPWRNSVILANVTGREPYPVERRIAFQQFGLPGGTVPDEQPDHQTRDEMEAAR